MSTIAAILILLGMYWVGLPIFQTLQGLALLGVIGVLIGNKALGVILDSPSSIKEKKD